MSIHSDVSELVALMKRERIAHYVGPFQSFSDDPVTITLHPSAFLPDAPPDAQVKPREPHPNPLFAREGEQE